MVIYDKNGTPIIGVEVDDTSYRYREIMGDCKVYLEFALTQHVELPIGAYVDFQGERYTLMSPADVTIQHNRDYEYKITFEGPQARFSKYRVHNPVDGRLVFEMIAQPQEFLNLVIANLNEREGSNVWSAGACITDTEKAVAFNHTKLNDALTMIANAFNTEWEVSGHSISLNKVEYNADSPLALGYGRNLGFKAGVGRTNYGETGQIERLFVQGGDRNISLKEYGASVLLLPKGFTFQFDGSKFKYTFDGSTYTETGFDSSKAVTMVTDENGFGVALSTAGPAANEESLDLTEIYPKRIGTVSDVRYLYDHEYLTWAQINALHLDEDEWLKVQVDIIDANIPAALDYAECLLANDQPLTVIFQSGMLAGREFSATFCKEARTAIINGVEVEQRPANRFELVRANIDGFEMPNATYRPNACSGNDTYIVVNCYMPDQYVCDKATFSGAEMEMLRKAAKFLYENKDIQFTFKGAIDDLYSKRNWTTVGGKLKLGGCVSFTHTAVQPTALVTRIVAVKDFINNPYTPEVTLSNESVKGGLSSRLATMDGQKAQVLARQYASDRMSRRSWRDAKETMQALADALLEGFTEGISPITVQTMQMLVGDESLQFRYVNSKTNPQPVAAGISYNPATKKLVCNANIIQHMTLGIDTVKDSHAVSEYKFWDIAAFESPYLGDALAEKKFYLYAKCNKAEQGQTGYQVAEYVLSETAIAMNSVTGYYHLLVGILNSEFDDDRSFVTLFGFTEVLPGRITTDKIASSSGTTFWDLVQNILHLGDKLQYDPTNGLILRGALVQTGSGEQVVIGAWCGEFDYNRTYQLGDEVWWEAADGTISTYRYINALPANHHYPSDDNYWMFSAKGIKGEDAESPVYADLDNEMDGVVVKSDGKTAAQYTLTTNAKMWYGTIAMVLSQISFSGLPTGVSASGNTSTGAITFTIASGTSLTTHEITITVKGTFGNVTYTRSLVFTIAGVKTGSDGGDGDDAIIYSLLPSVTAVKKNKNGVYSVANVSCKKMKRVGQNGIAETNEGTLKYTLDNGSSENTYSSAIATSSFSTCVTFLFYIGSTLVDRETVPLIVDGTDGSDGSDGNDGEDGNGIQSITEQYARSLNGTTPPSSWSDTKPSPSAGYFIWTKTTITYTKSSTPFITYSAVYCAEDGEDGQDGANGAPGPATPYRGTYSSSETYYATEKRCDVVYYPQTARWYVALYNGTDRTFTNKIPTNTAYWSDFGANFSNVATGLLFAVRAVIENAVVRILETNENGKRIVAEDDCLVMYDDNDDEKLRITGGNLSSASQTQSDSIPAGYPLASGQLYSLDFSQGISAEGNTSPKSFTVGEGAILNLPARGLTFELHALDNVTGNQAYVYFEAGYMVDGVKLEGINTYGTITPNNSSFYQVVQVDAEKIQLSAGSHTVGVWAKVEAYGDIKCDRGDYYVGFTQSIPFTVTYADQKTEIASNGFQVRFGSDQMLRCVKSGNDISFLMRADDYGIEVSTSGLKVRIGGTERTASFAYDSTIGGYVLKFS